MKRDAATVTVTLVVQQFDADANAFNIQYFAIPVSVRASDPLKLLEMRLRERLSFSVADAVSTSAPLDAAHFSACKLLFLTQTVSDRSLRFERPSLDRSLADLAAARVALLAYLVALSALSHAGAAAAVRQSSRLPPPGAARGRTSQRQSRRGPAGESPVGVSGFRASRSLHAASRRVAGRAARSRGAVPRCLSGGTRLLHAQRRGAVGGVSEALRAGGGGGGLFLSQSLLPHGGHGR